MARSSTDSPITLHPHARWVRMDMLSHSESVNLCSFKDDASYFSFGDHADVALSYEQPLAVMEAIAWKLVFDKYKGEVQVNDQ